MVKKYKSRPLSKLNQILYTWSVGPQNIKNAKKKRPKWEEGVKNENLGPWTKHNQKCMVKSSGGPHQNVSIYSLKNNSGYQGKLIHIERNFNLRNFIRKDFKKSINVSSAWVYIYIYILFFSIIVNFHTIYKQKMYLLIFL